MIRNLDAAFLLSRITEARTQLARLDPAKPQTRHELQRLMALGDRPLKEAAAHGEGPTTETATIACAHLLVFEVKDVPAYLGQTTRCSVCGKWAIEPAAAAIPCAHESVTTADGHGSYCRLCGETCS